MSAAGLVSWHWSASLLERRAIGQFNRSPFGNSEQTNEGKQTQAFCFMLQKRILTILFYFAEANCDGNRAHVQCGKSPSQSFGEEPNISGSVVQTITGSAQVVDEKSQAGQINISNGK